MSDISTFTKAKDWAIIALVGIAFSLLGMVASENRDRIRKNSEDLAQQRQDIRNIYVEMTKEMAVIKAENTYLRRELDRSDKRRNTDEGRERD